MDRFTINLAHLIFYSPLTHNLNYRCGKGIEIVQDIEECWTSLILSPIGICHLFLTIVGLYLLLSWESGVRKRGIWNVIPRDILLSNILLKLGKNEIETKNTCYFNSFKKKHNVLYLLTGNIVFSEKRKC